MAEVDGPETKSGDDLDFTLDDIDDKEFDIPVVENPTLESILNEPDDDSPIHEDDLVPEQLLQGDQGDTGSISSQDSVMDSKTRKRPKKSIHYDKHGLILRHVVLKGISAQMLSAADRVDAGMSTAMAVASLIAVGTSHGLVLVFDPKQVLKWCLGSTAVGVQYGAVSALSFNKDCTRLICGFARGQMTMWDLTNGKLLRTISDAHPPGTAVLHVKFTDDLTVAVCSDSGGSVFELEMKRLIGVRTCESRCLFSGSRGEVCTIEPLHMQHNIPDHPMKEVIILAMASLTKVLIVTVRPQLKVLFMHQLHGDQSTLPLLAWQFVIIQVSEQDRVVDPVLAFARDQTIYFAQVFCTNPENIKVSPLQKTDLPYKLLSITWMNSRTMVALDTSERAHVIDVRTEEELEVLDIGDVQLVYSTSFYKSLATGGNVSKALAYAGERACYQSITSYNGQLVLLGTKGVHVMTLRSWEERLDVLAKHNKYEEALVLAKSFYDGKAKAVMGLAGSSSKRKAAVTIKMLELLLKYIDVAMTSQRPETVYQEEVQEYFHNIAPVCIEHCLTLDRLDILFGDIYDRFSADPTGHGVFLECLEPYILSDRLTSITPSVMQAFVSHCQQRGLLRNVEACIVHMDIASLDIHQVVVLCWANALYDAILYIYNRGMLDFVTPLEELLGLLRKAVNSGKQLADDQIKLGNKLLVYISCCLAGRAYPLGDIPEHLVSEVKDKVFKCVTCLHTKDHDEDEPIYPHLRSLLQFDTREFFNVLALAFEEEEFNTEEGSQQRQRVVDILLQIMVESVGFTPTQIGILFTFLARQMARRESSIMVNRVLFEQVLESLCSPGKDSRHEEREQALMELLGAGGLAHFEEERLIKLAENAHFFRVCEMLYENRREFDKILSCYLRDPYRQHQAFQYIEYILTEQHFSLQEKTRVREEAVSHLKELVGIDSRKTAQLVIVNFANNLPEIVSQLQDTKPVLYDFLQGVFEYRESSGSAIFAERQFPVESNVQEIYIELMAEFNPENVCNYIKMADGYRLEEVLEICRHYKLPDATAHILEKTGDVQGAFNLMLESLQNKMKALTNILEGSEKDGGQLAMVWTRVQASLLVVIQLCQRNGSKLDEKQRESIWFPLLEVCMLPQRQLKDKLDPRDVEAFKEITRHVLNGMMGYIALPAILQKIMQDPVYNTGRFGEIRELLLGMLDTYNYEKTLLRTCANLVNHDLHHQLAALTAAASRGVALRNDLCSVCNKSVMQCSDGDTVIGFRCGHGYHQACLRAVRSKVILDGEETWLCYVCNKTRRGGVTSSSRLLRPPSFSKTSPNGPDIPTKSNKMEIELEPEQIQAVESLRRVQKSPSRMAMLMELARQDKASGSIHRATPSSTSIFQNERFQLQLAPPPPVNLTI